MQLSTSIKKRIKKPDSTQFSDTISVIDANYTYIPSTLMNDTGEDKIANDAGTNEGSCKLFPFAQDQGFNETQTLHCGGKYCRKDVVSNPRGSDHANIRNFMTYGWEGIHFEHSSIIKNHAST